MYKVGIGIIQPKSYLTHELWNDPVEGGAPVSEPLFSGAKRPEVLSRLGHDVLSQLHDDATQLLAVGSHVEVDLKKDSRSDICILKVLFLRIVFDKYVYANFLLIKRI